MLRYAGLWVDVFLKMRGTLRKNDFACRSNAHLEQGTTMRCAVFLSDHSMRMNDRLSILQRNVSEE